MHLKPFTEPDIESLLNCINSEKEMVAFAGPVFTWPWDAAQLKNHLRANDRLFFKALDEQIGYVGVGELNRIDLVHGNARICRVLICRPELRGKGLGRELIKALVHYGFEELHLHRIDLGVFTDNPAAKRCYESCGFQTEGLLQDNVKLNGKYLSTFNMAILNKETV